MKLRELHVENFRAFSDFELALGRYTCLVGPNGAGKSTVLAALNVFFREPTSGSGEVGVLSDEDFHCKDTSMPVRITLCFDDLSAEAQEAFAGYYRQGTLVVSAIAEWDAQNQRAPVRHFGSRLGMVEFAPFFASVSSGTTVPQLKVLYADLKKAHPELASAATKAAMEEALHEFEAAHPELCSLIPSEDQFYGFSRGANRLEQFIQWVFVPAVKDASEENREARDTALGKLLARTVRAKVSFAEGLSKIRADAQSAYGLMLAEQQTVLSGVSGQLQDRLREWSHPGTSLEVKWADDSSSAVKIAEPAAQLLVGEDLFAGHPGRLGHGLQRSLLIALLQELAGSVETGPKLLLACEEPELYQHPPQARYLAGVLERLADESAQVVVCTHSPQFVVGSGFEDVRMIRKERHTGQVRGRRATFADVAADIATSTGKSPEPVGASAMKLHQELQPQLNEMFFANGVVFVEGIEDASFLGAYLVLTGRIDDVRQRGCHVVSVGGKGHLLRPFTIARRLGIPAIVVHDADGNEQNAGRRGQHEKDNSSIQRAAACSEITPFPASALLHEHLIVYPETLASSVKGEVSKELWSRAADEARSRCDAIGVGGLEKNAVLIGETLRGVLAERTRIECLEWIVERMLRLGEPAGAAQRGPTR